MPWDFILKILFTVLTLAVGYQGGEVMPLFSIGASAGFILASVLGLPVDICVALGFVGVFGSATNTFFAPVFVGAEIFGAEYIPAFVIVCSLAYMCNGNRSVYSLQKYWEHKSESNPLATDGERNTKYNIKSPVNMTYNK